jgi:thiol-disulfide isomerase/thioredoxin
MNRFIVIAIVLVGIIGIGFVATQTTTPPTTPIQEPASTPSVESTTEADVSPVVERIEATESEAATPVEPTSAASADSGTVSSETQSSAPTAPSSGTYATYSPEAVAQSNADKIVLFFHATWCPSCRALDRDIAANLSAIPTGVAIFKADYDTSTALKQQYGVTRQHSIILIKADGSAQSAITHPLTFTQLINAL